MSNEPSRAYITTKILQRRYRRLLKWRKPVIHNIRGPYHPDVFDGFAFDLALSIRVCKETLQDMTDEEFFDRFDLRGEPGAIAFQNPEAHFTTGSPRAELAALGMQADRITRALEDWGLSAQADQHPFTLSMGQKRRLALALLTETDRWPPLILDEPTTGLDWRGTERVAERIRALAQSGRALAVITHDVDFALSVCHRVAILSDGKLAAEGPAPEILLNAPLLKRAGLALPEVAPLLHRMKSVAC